METIKNYLDNMFAALSKTQELLDLKSEILSNMEEKYLELKREGKSENEAIGIVISEFGNIDELVSEMGLNNQSNQNQSGQLREVSLEEAQAFLKAKKKSNSFIAMGVSLIFLGVIGMLLLFNLGPVLSTDTSDLYNLLPVAFLLIMIAFAVGIFIYTGQGSLPYAYIEKGEFFISSSTKHFLEAELAKATPKMTLATVIGVILCILSPIHIFVSLYFFGEDSILGVCGLLFNILIAVFIFICFSSEKSSYHMLLQLEDYSLEAKKANPLIGAVAGIVWPLATFSFLILGLVFDLWYICWIIFPVTGVLFGGFVSIYKSTHSNHA